MRPNKLLALIASLFMSLVLIAPTPALAAKKPTLAIDSNTVGMTKQEKKVYKKLKAQKAKAATREGKKWGDAKFYSLGGRTYYYSHWGNIGGGYACHAFALKMSDVAFGKKAHFKVHKKWSKIKVGDVVRYLNDGHRVIVLKVVGSKYVVAEGNYDGKVHWGRVITRSEFRKTGTYVLTRY